jgi:hypothetical protein
VSARLAGRGATAAPIYGTAPAATSSSAVGEVGFVGLTGVMAGEREEDLSSVGFMTLTET